MGIKTTLATTKQVLGRKLAIPDYQRPYRWTTKNVMQLLVDISSSMAAGKREYRVGTMICYKSLTEDGNYYVVDGQQRLTTILLVLRELYIGKDVREGWSAELEKLVELKLSQLCYRGDSVATICENRKFIEEWLLDNVSDDGMAIAGYILNKCKFADIIVDDLSEAFQMFDTQNGRGKSLEIYNLLKAYHIRAMDQNSQDEKIRCDRNWEGATQYDATPDIPNDPNVDILGQLFGEQLFKSRLWCRNEDARPFSRDDIEEFKGLTIDKNHSIDYPFQNPFLLQYLTEKFYRNVLAGTIGTKPRFEVGETEKVNPFVNVNQTIINGRAFFEYIETYVELYKKMFIEIGSYQLAEFKRFFYLHCLTYRGDDQNNPNAQKTWDEVRTNSEAFRHKFDGAGRTGDTYLRESYKSLCFILLDKFGERVFLKYYKTLYRLIYRIRIQKRAVKFQTAMSMPTTLFAIIYRAKNEVELLALNNKLSTALQEEKFEWPGKLESLEHFIKTGAYHA